MKRLTLFFCRLIWPSPSACNCYHPYLSDFFLSVKPANDSWRENGVAESNKQKTLGLFLYIYSFVLLNQDIVFSLLWERSKLITACIAFWSPKVTIEVELKIWTLAYPLNANLLYVDCIFCGISST